jgi:hypothetical protein
MAVFPGFFAIPIHDHGGFADLVSKAQPSAIAGHISAWSPKETAEWRKRSPSTFILLIHGEVADDQFDWRDPAGQARRHMEMILQAATREDGEGYQYPVDNAAWMLLNEPNLWFDEKDNSGAVVCTGEEKRRRFCTYCETALDIAHPHGLNLSLFNFSVGWPLVLWIDSLDYWPSFASIVKKMCKGDIANLHEYWDTSGPLACWPYLTGRHVQCPFQTLGDGTKFRILIGEFGLDQATTQGFPNRGYRLFMTAAQYYQQVRDFHACLTDDRIFGSSGFMWDNADETRWWSFDLRGDFTAMFNRADFASLADPMIMPSRILYPLDSVRITQRFGENPADYAPLAGHNGVDFSCVVGTPLRAMADGKVVHIGDEGKSGYGLYMDVNHGPFISRTAHLSAPVKGDQQLVKKGEIIALSGNTGRSTGPHTHIGIRIWGRWNAAYNGWQDPMPFFEGVAPIPAPEPAPTPAPSPVDVVTARWHAEEAARTLEQAEVLLTQVDQSLQAADKLREDAESRLKFWVIPAMRRVEGV